MPIPRSGSKAFLWGIALACTAVLSSSPLSSSPLLARDYRFNRADYGQRIEGVQGDVDVWWCEATWKVHQQRTTPEAAAPAATLAAAQNDREAVQVVVRPAKDLRQLTASLGDLAGPGGATIPAKNAQILRVYYHFVKEPTDRLSVRDWWPDALPPLDAPLDLAAGKNQPLWVLIHVPKDAKPGDYAGTLSLKAEGWSAAVPIKLHVWGFALPEVNHIETAFGVSPGMISAYHHLKTEADKRRVWDMYMRNLADHRMSPYDPVPFDSIRVKFDFDADPARADVDFSAFDPAMSRAIDEYHFTNWRLHIEGVHGALGKFGEDTPQYQAAFSSYMKQLESHFREKGWMNRPYAYWTDEPKPEKYPEVQAGMERIKKYSPGIRTMITTNHPDGTLQGPIDIWCPVSYNYKPDSAKERMAAGAKYWWYVCTGPKAPFCTLFIDHPATDLRVWLWQTWQRNIEGVLIWETTYWRLGGEQNPYEDPMAYCGEPGLKTYGNGDGRFIYPPLAAASPAGADKAPVLDPPVSCIRSEMLREGIEDYEMLWLLRDLLAKKKSSLTPDQEKAYQALLQVPENITTTMTAFTTDPRPIYARRAEIAEAIERLSK